MGCSKEAYLKPVLLVARIWQPPPPTMARRNVNNNLSIGMVRAEFRPRPCLVLFETDSGSDVRVLRQRHDRSSANIQVAGDTQLLQVFEHRGHWQRKLQLGSSDALLRTPANSLQASSFAVRFAATRSCRALAARQRGYHRHALRPSSTWQISGLVNSQSKEHQEAGNSAPASARVASVFRDSL